MNEEMMNRQEQIAALRRYGALSERSKAYWGEEERQKLEDMFYEGVDISEMALHFQRTESAIMSQLCQRGMHSFGTATVWLFISKNGLDNSNWD